MPANLWTMKPSTTLEISAKIRMELASLLVAIATLISVVISGIFSWKSMTRKKEIQILKKELLDLYLDVHQLLQIEENLTHEIESSKIEVRKPYSFSTKIYPSNVNRRINELENDK